MPTGLVLSEPSLETAQWPTVVFTVLAADVAVESGERVVSASAVTAASAIAAPNINSILIDLPSFLLFTRQFVFLLCMIPNYCLAAN